MSALVDNRVKMKYQYIIDNILGQKTKIKALRYLVQHPDEQSGRRVAIEAGINHWQCHKVLRDLYEQGILNMKHAGNTYLFKLRRNQYIVEKAIIPLFNIESRIKENMACELKNIVTKCLPVNERKDIISSILFGSIATGKEKTHSDIDIMLIVKNKTDKQAIVDFILKQNDYFISRYGNTLSPYVLTREEFMARYKKKDQLIESAVLHGNVLFGKTAGEIITDES